MFNSQLDAQERRIRCRLRRIGMKLQIRGSTYRIYKERPNPAFPQEPVREYVNRVWDDIGKLDVAVKNVAKSHYERGPANSRSRIGRLIDANDCVTFGLMKDDEEAVIVLDMHCKRLANLEEYRWRFNQNGAIVCDRECKRLSLVRAVAHMFGCHDDKHRYTRKHRGLIDNVYLDYTRNNINFPGDSQ